MRCSCGFKFSKAEGVWNSPTYFDAEGDACVICPECAKRRKAQ